MKWDVSYTRKTTGETVFYSQDDELNALHGFVEAPTKETAIICVKNDISELMLCNCLAVEDTDDGISVFEPTDHDFIEHFLDFSAVKIYELLDAKGMPFLTHNPGMFGGHRKLKIYGRLDCPSALRHISNGNYIKHRVFFPDEETAKSAGYRPCAICMRAEYNEWKGAQEK